MLSRLPTDSFSGIFPDSGLIVGRSFSKEEIKDFLFRSMKNPTLSDCVFYLEDLAKKIVGVSEWVAEPTRMLVLEQIYRKWSRIRPFPELQKLKRKRSFFERLDYAIQKTRMLAASTEEERVFLETLESKGKSRALHNEIFMISRAYEAWLEEASQWDIPRTFDAAVEILKTKGWPETVHLPKTWYFTDPLASYRYGRYKNLIEELSRWTKVKELTTDTLIDLKSVDPIEWSRFHTVWDAADELARQILRLGVDSNLVVVYSESFENRRALWETFKKYKIPLLDPRDPLDIRLDERNKKAWMPFELVASGFEVSSLIYYFQSLKDYRFPVQEIYASGKNRGCFISPYREWIEDFSSVWSTKRTVQQWEKTHLEWIERSGIFSHESDRIWIRQLLKEVWERLKIESELLLLSTRKVSSRWILERVRIHLKHLQGRAPALRPDYGIRLYRIEQQCIDESIEYCFAFGWSPSEWDLPPDSNIYLNAQERSFLHLEFGIDSPEQNRIDRLNAAKKWVQKSKKIHWLDYSISANGKTRESIKSVLIELGLPIQAEDEPRILFPTRPWKESYRPIHPFRPRPVYLPVLEDKKNFKIKATDLDRYSRCPFLFLGSVRWKLRDFRPPEFEPYPEVRGVLLHRIVQKMVKNDTYDYSKYLEEEIQNIRFDGMIDSDRLKERFILKLKTILEKFATKEQEYRKRSQVIPLYLDEKEVQAVLPSGRVYGKPDRVDQYQDGFFVIDYKTSSFTPTNGKKILEKGYGLQLPTYALALLKEHQKTIYGFQYIELNTKGGRTNGIYFAKWNGKDQGKLTDFNKNSASLLNDEPESVWSRLELLIENELQSFQSGNFSSTPKDPKDCASCPMQVVCGEHRRYDSQTEVFR